MPKTRMLSHKQHTQPQPALKIDVQRTPAHLSLIPESVHATTDIDARSSELHNLSQAARELAGKMGTDQKTVTRGLNRLVNGVKLTLLTSVTATSLLIGSQAAVPHAPAQQEPKPAVAAAPPEVLQETPALSAFPSMASADMLLKQSGEDLRDGKLSRTGLWDKLPQAERAFWENKAESMGLRKPLDSFGEEITGPDAIKTNASREAHLMYRRWSGARTDDQTQFFYSLDGWERMHWLNKSMPSTPQITEGMSQGEACQQVRKYLTSDTESWNAAEKAALDHYKAGNQRPKSPVTNEEYAKTVKKEVDTRFKRVSEGRELVSKFKPQSKQDEQLLEKANKALFNRTVRAASSENYMLMGPRERFNDADILESIELTEHAFKHVAREHIAGMAGGQRRIEILDNYGAALFDGPGKMSAEDVEVVAHVLENTPPHLRTPKLFKGGIIQDVISESDRKRDKGTYTAASHTAGWNMTRLVVAPTKDNMHHEFGHGIHEVVLGLDGFAEYARLGGWKFKETDGSVMEIPEKGTMRTLYSGEDSYVKPPLSTVVREYGLTDPCEDAATMHEAITSDTAKLIREAAQRGDKPFMNKIGWWLDNVIKNPETGQYCVWEDSQMRECDNIRGFINDAVNPGGEVKQDVDAHEKRKLKTVYGSDMRDY